MIGVRGGLNGPYDRLSDQTKLTKGPSSRLKEIQGFYCLPTERDPRLLPLIQLGPAWTDFYGLDRDLRLVRQLVRRCPAVPLVFPRLSSAYPFPLHLLTTPPD